MSSFDYRYHAPPLGDVSQAVEHLLAEVHTLSGDEITRRLDDVLETTYLLFSERDKNTNWPRLLWLYEGLMDFHGSSVLALNRAMAVANVHGPQAGMDAVATIRDQDKLQACYLFYAVLGELEAQLNDPLAAAGYFRKSVQFAEVKSMRSILLKRFEACQEQLVDQA